MLTALHSGIRFKSTKYDLVNMREMKWEDLLEALIIDGINVYVRDVLVPNGFVNTNDLGSEKLLKLKHEIARKWASQWVKVFLQDMPCNPAYPTPKGEN